MSSKLDAANRLAATGSDRLRQPSPMASLLSRVIVASRTTAWMLARSLLMGEASRSTRDSFRSVPPLRFSTTDTGSPCRPGFFVTRTSLLLARDLEDADADITADPRPVMDVREQEGDLLVAGQVTADMPGSIDGTAWTVYGRDATRTRMD